jgi:hypothetical protein
LRHVRRDQWLIVGGVTLVIALFLWWLSEGGCFVLSLSTALGAVCSRAFDDAVAVR